MSDYEKVGLIPYENSGKRPLLRLAALAVLLLSTGAALFLCWKEHFGREALLRGGFIIAISLYLANFFYRRSRGLSARLFENYTGPDDDPSRQDQADMGALVGLVIAIGYVAYKIIGHW
jgi:hypothetical protein